MSVFSWTNTAAVRMSLDTDCHCMWCNKIVSGLKWSRQGNTHFLNSAIHLEAVSFIIMEYTQWSHPTIWSILWSVLVRTWQVQLVISLNLLPFHATLSFWKRKKSNDDNLVSRDSVEWYSFVLKTEIPAQSKQTEYVYHHDGETTPIQPHSTLQPVVAAHFPTGTIICPCIHSNVGLQFVLVEHIHNAWTNHICSV